MPFKSEKQRRFMWMRHPDIAKRWTQEYGSTPVNKYGRVLRKKNGRTAIQR